MKELKARLKYYYFLLRWFLIGRNFCDMPAWCKKSFWIGHKILWFFIFVNCAMGLNRIFVIIGV